MGLSDASWFAATVAILLGIYIGERILDIDFSVFLAKNRKKGKIKRMMEQRGDTTLQKSEIRRDIRKAFERILIPLEKADKNRLPSRMDMTFRKNIVRQIDRLNQQKLCREILMTDVETQPDNDFERWNNDGREWRESIIKCSALERLISTEDGKIRYENYRKHAYLRILQSRHIRNSDRVQKKKSYYSTVQKIICPSCGASVELTGQQVVCEYCGGVIRSEFYDWQTERFEVYERIGTNLRRALLLTGAMGIVYVCVFLCLYMIEDTEVSLTAGVGAALLVFVLILVSNQFFRNRQEKMADSIVRYSENYLRSCIGDAIYNETESDELMDYGIGNITLKKVVNTEDITKIKVKVCASEIYLPDRRNPYTKKVKRTLIMQRARYPERRREDGVFFMEKECPSCGANFVPDENHCCSFCGYSLKSDNAKWILVK